MGDDADLLRLIESYESLAVFHDAAADELVAKGEREGWHDDLTQQVDWARHQARTCQMLAQEVRDGMAD